ncbi:ABC transporter substrate-binding protein [Clostridium cellulovorans]|uniref:Extracellular solute-binding protein family 1 n=1 Tax=Clostridium cellulovorans (strain ATCC 35296 / DSM 3052 / OCM 3 / 743B) TaxID=573061 RepID=D9STP4_CLOC7|nr:ABC transporter substrate-binding protein [Clostridium cellulovorans]ADL52778.1 extracellular solute-binding protein family 1 [Clostridium cellulovorans 743B]
MKKNKIFKKLLVGVLVATLIPGILGCSNKNIKDESVNKSGEKVTLKMLWWGNDKRKGITEDVIKLYQKNHPNVEFQTESVSSTADIKKDLALKTAEGEIPDIIQMDLDFIYNYAERKLLEPLDSYIDQNVLNLSDVDEASLEGGRLNEQLYGVPLGINAYCLVVNPTVFEKAGVGILENGYTYDDLYKTAKELKAKITDSDFYPIANFIDFNSFVRSKGSFYFGESGTELGYTDDKIMAEYLSIQKKWVDEGLIVPPSNKTDKNTLIASGKSALMYGTSNSAAGISKTAKTVMKIITVPSVTKGNITSSIRQSMFFSVSSYSKYKKEAVEFINFFTNDLEANNILMGDRGVPISDKVSESLQQKITEADKQQYTFMEYIKQHPSSVKVNPPNPNTSGNVNSLLSILYNDVISGKTTPEEASKKFREKGNKILEGFKGGQ